RIERSPADAAARSRQNLVGGEAAAHRKNHRREMNDDADAEHGGTGTLHEPQQRLPARGCHVISPAKAARVTARFNPAIEAVGARCLGQRSLQLWCVWQAWHPASPATAASRCIR